MSRISRCDSVFDADTTDQTRATLPTARPGRYHVDEIRATTIPCGSMSRARGRLTRQAGRIVADDPYPRRE
jgi:hypothetical protein